MIAFSNAGHAAADVQIQGAPAAVNSSAFSVSILFSADVTGFVSTDVVVGNAAVTGFSAVSAANYDVEITPNGVGDISIDVPAGMALDSILEENTAAAQVVVVYDAIVPDVQIQGAPTIVNSTAAFNVTVVFSEVVTGFIDTDVSVTNGSATSVTSGDGITYNVEITPDGGGDISIDIPAGVAQDVAQNGNSAATQVNVPYDPPPGVDIQGEPATVSSDVPFNVTIQFSEAVSGFEVTDISIVNAVVSDFIVVDGATYIAEITLTEVDDISIDIAAGVAQDAGLNFNSAATQAVIVFVNIAPLADAGADRFVNEGATVTLDGSASSDLSPDAVVGYAWTQTAGPTVTLDDASAEVPRFTTPYVLGAATLRFDLVVTDRVGASSTPDSVTLTVANGLAVDAGVDQQVTEGDIVRLDGLNSLSINRRINRYQWTQIEGPLVALEGSNTARPGFVAPQVDAPTPLVFRLDVRDASGARDFATTLVNVRDQSSSATAAPLQVDLVSNTVSSGAIYQFDTNGDPFGFNAVEWSQLSGPDLTLNGASTALPSFTAPTLVFDAAAGFEVRSTDINGLVARADVYVNILEPLSTNLPPVADAGVDLVATEGETVQLDATASTDADGSVIGYLWRQRSGPGVSLSSILHARPTFVAPAITAADSGVALDFEVAVIDNDGFIDRGSVTVTIVDNGTSGFVDDLTTIDSALGDPLGIRIDSGSLISLHAVHPVSIVDSVNRPAFLPYGLLDFGLRVEPGSSVEVSFILPEPAGSDLTWWKYTASDGWVEYAGDVSFNATRDVVTVTLTDNGIGDDDPVLGVIRDPGGLAPESVQPESGGITRENGSSGSGSMGPYLVVFLLLYAFVAVGRARD